MSYMRVVPRDLFNESKLLKCLGQISIAILDNKLGKYGVEDYLEDADQGFIIDHTDDGDTYCSNYKVLVPMLDKNEKAYLQLFSRLNSKEAYPLICMTHDNEVIEVFTEKGVFTTAFLLYLKFINNY